MKGFLSNSDKKFALNNRKRARDHADIAIREMHEQG